MRFKLSEEYKESVIYDLSVRPLPDDPFKQMREKSGYWGLLEETKKFVYGYAKTVAKEEIKKQKWQKKSGPQFGKFEIDWSYVPTEYTVPSVVSVPATVTYPSVIQPYYEGTITVSGTETGYINPSTTGATTSNSSGIPSIYNISDISARILNKVKEIVNNVRK